MNTEYNKIDIIQKNIGYYDKLDSEFHKGILDLSTKFRQLVIEKSSVTFEEEEIISRYLFQKNNIYSGITFNPIEFYKDRNFYLKLHERLLFESKSRNNDFYNCRIVITDLEDLRKKIYLNTTTREINLENKLNLWLFIKWHQDYNVKLYSVTFFDFSTKVYQNILEKHPKLWTRKMGIFFKKHILLMDEKESFIENRLERRIQIVNSDSEEYKAGLKYFTELYNNKGDFVSLIYNEFPEVNLTNNI